MNFIMAWVCDTCGRILDAEKLHASRWRQTVLRDGGVHDAACLDGEEGQAPLSIEEDINSIIGYEPGRSKECSYCDGRCFQVKVMGG